MMDLKEGDLVQVLNEDGEIVDLALYIRHVIPDKDFDNCRAFFDDYQLGSYHWHWEVFLDGKVVWLPTEFFTLMPV